ncbi:MAG: hypothetical protein IMY71_14225 [Bacteroidetes bacterium]|nr:hypothetical protein [Bacteroidota bacterium]
MPRLFCYVLSIILLIPLLSDAKTIDVQIKGIDDGVKTSKQQDYKEAVLFAKREAIERAGIKIKSITTVKDLMVESDYIETQAEAVLLAGYTIVDMGYSADGTYQVVLVGKVKAKQNLLNGFVIKDLCLDTLAWGMSVNEVKSKMDRHVDFTKKKGMMAELNVLNWVLNPEINWDSTEGLKKRAEEFLAKGKEAQIVYKTSDPLPANFYWITKTFELHFLNNSLQKIVENLSIEIEDKKFEKSWFAYYCGTKKEQIFYEYDECLKRFKLKYGPPAYQESYEAGWTTKQYIVTLSKIENCIGKKAGRVNIIYKPQEKI